MTDELPGVRVEPTPDGVRLVIHAGKIEAACAMAPEAAIELAEILRGCATRPAPVVTAAPSVLQLGQESDHTEIRAECPRGCWGALRRKPLIAAGPHFNPPQPIYTVEGSIPLRPEAPVIALVCEACGLIVGLEENRE